MQKKLRVVIIYLSPNLLKNSNKSCQHLDNARMNCFTHKKSLAVINVRNKGELPIRKKKHLILYYVHNQYASFLSWNERRITSKKKNGLPHFAFSTKSFRICYIYIQHNYPLSFCSKAPWFMWFYKPIYYLDGSNNT